MKKYYLFDFDGTLVDSLTYWREAGHDYLIEHNLKPADDFYEVTKPMGYAEMSVYYKELYNIDVTFEELRNFEREVMRRHYKSDVKLTPGARQTIERLKKEGCTLAILTFTESSLVREYLENAGLLDYFEFILSGADTHLSKTEKEIYYKGLDMLGVGAKDVVYVEDSLFALRVANSVGMETVGVYEKVDSADAPECKKEATFYINSFLEFDETKY